MNSNIITKRKWFWAWDDDKEEAWLAELSKQGLHLVNAQLFGAYKFIQGESKNYAYRLDFQTPSQKDKAAYIQLFEDAGWEHVVEMNGWHYFRKEVTDSETPEIFSDNKSKAEKYRRLLAMMFFLPLFYPMYFSQIVLRSSTSPLHVGLSIIYTTIMLFSIYAIVRIFIRIKQLERKI